MLLAAVLVLAPVSSSTDVFALDPLAGTLHRSELDDFSSGLRPVGPTGASVEALDFDAAGRHLWAVARAAGGGLEAGDLDLETGAFTARAALPLTGPVTDLASGPDGHTWYVAESVGPDAVVWRGHLPSGTLVPWATLTGSGPLTGLAVDLEGGVVACRAVDGALVGLDEATGATHVLSTLPPGAPLPFGLEVDWATGHLLATVDRAAPRLVRLEPQTGAAVLVATLGANAPLLRLAVRRAGEDLVTANVCAPAQANSTGVAARIGAQGSAQLERNDLVLRAGSMPANSFGQFLVSLEAAAPVAPPGSVGRLCLGGTVGRLTGGAQLLATGASGTFSLPVDLGAVPQGGATLALVESERLYFQAWYRDVLAGTATSNFTAAARVDVAPRIEGDLFAERGLPATASTRVTHCDLDGDGYEEVLLTDWLQRIEVHWNRDGRLERGADIELWDGINQLTHGDVDGDGDQDLVVSTGSTIHVGWNEGGEFPTWTPATSCWSVVQVVVRDLDADGRADLVYHCSPHGRVRVVHSEPGRTFTAATVVHFTEDPGSVAVADVDGDGYPELMQASGARFEYRRGAPGRSFGPVVEHPLAGWGSAPEVVDVDADGDLDVALLPGHVLTGIQWMRNDGGALVPATPIPLPANRFAAGFGDVDGDGTNDLAVIGTFPRVVHVLRGLGGAVFEPLADVVTGTSPQGADFVDLDLDGRDEALVLDRNAAYLTILRRSLTGEDTGPVMVDVPIGSTGSEGPGVTPLDVDGDGDLDLLVTTTMPLGARHLVLQNRGDGTFLPHEEVPTPRGAGDIEAADLDGDGHVDLLQVDAGRSWVHAFLGDGLGGFTAGPPIVLPTTLIPNTLAVGDVDGDGHVDAVLAQRGFMLLLGDGAGGFGVAGTVTDPTGFYWNDLRLVDLDADGALDLLARVGGMAIVAWGDGTGGFAPPVQLVTARRDLAVADFDGDGRLDVLGVGFYTSTEPTAEYALQRSGRSFDVELVEMRGRPVDVEAADLDADGLPDVVLTFDHSSSPSDRNHLGIALNDGFAGLREESWFHGRDKLRRTLVADLDGDGAPEICVFDLEEAALAIFAGGGL